MDSTDIINHAMNALAQSVSAILAADLTEENRAEELALAFGQCEQYLATNGIVAKSKGLDYQHWLAKRFGRQMAKLSSDRKVGAAGLAASVIDHALDALDRKRQRHGYVRKQEDTTMSNDLSLEKILKDYGVVKICKHIVSEGRTGYTEFELVSALTKCASEMYPELTPAQAFEKLFAQEVVWKAVAVAKSPGPSRDTPLPFTEATIDFQPRMITGQDAKDLVTDPEVAMQTLAQIGRKNWPNERADVQFSNAMQDPANAQLARRAVPIPAPTTSFAFPR